MANHNENALNFTVNQADELSSFPVQEQMVERDSRSAQQAIGNVSLAPSFLNFRGNVPTSFTSLAPSSPTKASSGIGPIANQKARHSFSPYEAKDCTRRPAPSHAVRPPPASASGAERGQYYFQLRLRASVAAAKEEEAAKAMASLESSMEAVSMEEKAQLGATETQMDHNEVKDIPHYPL